MSSFELYGKLNIIKRQKISLLGLQVLLTGLWNLQDIQNLGKNSSKNKLICENAVTRGHGSCSLRVKGSLPWNRAQRSFTNLVTNNYMYRLNTVFPKDCQILLEV